MNELEKQLHRLNDITDKASKVETLYSCSHCGHGKDGFAFLEGELQKVLDGIKTSAVSNKLLGDTAAHASLVGAYNAMNSFLTQLHAWRENGPKAAAQIQELRSQNAEEIDRLGL